MNCQTKQFYTCSKLAIEAPEQGLKMCSKLKIKTVERWRRSALKYTEIHSTGSQKTYFCSKSTMETLK